MANQFDIKDGNKSVATSGKPKTARLVVTVILFSLGAFLSLGLSWLLSIWHDITFDEIVFYLSAPLAGT